MKKTLRSLLLAGAAFAACLGVAQADDVVLKASHQWPGGKGDVRDEMVQILAKEVAAANVGVEIRISTPTFAAATSLAKICTISSRTSPLPPGH